MLAAVLLACLPFLSLGDDLPEPVLRHRAILDRHPGHPVLFRHYLDLLFRAGRLDAARDYVRERRLAEPENPLPGVMEGYLALLADDPEAARGVLAAFHDRELSSELAAVLEEIYSERRFWREAAALLQARPGDPAQIGQRRFRYLVRAGDLEAAVRALVPFLVKHPGAGIELLFAEAGQAPEAATVATVLRSAMATATGADQLGLGRVLIRVLVHLGQAEEALATCHALGAAVGDETLLFLADALEALGNEEAVRRLLLPLADGPIAIPLRLRLAGILLRQDPARALALLGAVAPEAGGTAYARIHARALARLGRAEEAIAILRILREMDFTDRELLGLQLLGLGRMEEAEAEFTRLPQPRQGTGLALAALLAGDRERARRSLDTALAGPQEGIEYRDALELAFLLRGSGETNRMQALARLRIAEAGGTTASVLSNRLFLADSAGEAFWRESAGLAVAAALEAAGRPAEALVGYGRIGGVLAGHALFHKANLLLGMPGREGEARETFMDLIARHPASPYLFEARRVLAERP